MGGHDTLRNLEGETRGCVRTLPTTYSVFEVLFHPWGHIRLRDFYNFCPTSLVIPPSPKGGGKVWICFCSCFRVFNVFPPHPSVDGWGSTTTLSIQPCAPPKRTAHFSLKRKKERNGFNLQDNVRTAIQCTVGTRSLGVPLSRWMSLASAHLWNELSVNFQGVRDELSFQLAQDFLLQEELFLHLRLLSCWCCNNDHCKAELFTHSAVSEIFWHAGVFVWGKKATKEVQHIFGCIRHRSMKSNW